MNTLEEINQHIEANEAKIEPAVKDSKLSEIWPIAKPVLLALAKFPFIPKKWKTVIKALATIIDSYL